MGIRWLGGKSLHNSRGTAQIFLRVAFNVPSGLNGFVADLLMASDGK